MVGGREPVDADGPADHEPLVHDRRGGLPCRARAGRGATELGPAHSAAGWRCRNAPASAYGRSAVSDNGTLELYTGPPPPGSVAECDTTSTNLPREADVRPGSAHLTASCTPAPSATTTADGAFSDSSTLSSGSGSSSATGDGGSDAASGSTTADVSDFGQGPVHIGSAHYEATARSDGTPEGAAGSGLVTVNDATINGIPVIVGADGVHVDQTKVPAELVSSATSAVHDALGQGGYLDIRAAQPEVSIAADGSAVTVRGGGVFFEGQSNDPTQPYFVRQTLVGGSLTVAVGSDISGGTVAETPPPDPGVVITDGGTPTGRTAVVQGGGEVAVPSAPVPELITQRTVHRTSPFSLSWLWIVAVLAALTVAGVAFHRRAEPWWDAIADRYVRG